jgi:hypothetical protein
VIYDTQGRSPVLVGGGAKFEKFLQYKHIFLIFFLKIYIITRVFEKFSPCGSASDDNSPCNKTSAFQFHFQGIKRLKRPYIKNVHVRICTNLQMAMNEVKM